MTIPTSWDVVHSCGHEWTHDLSGRPADRRAAFSRWLSGRDCTDCWRATQAGDSADRKEWLAARRAAEQQAATEWAERFGMPPLDGPEKILGWGERCRHQLTTAAHTALAVEGSWDETRWTALEEQIRAVTRAGWWLDQRDTNPADLPELLNAATESDRGTENPFL
ncbi:MULTISPECIES: hypothetical protein [Streptomyces]|uniref:Uncharacterized protein n=1 Tax=Streptomyces tsukubensis (strain DSM 42081 / NBRC 108919 / NRRL 18488 / 9993) TaxID=1114943 RepID=I2N7X5_STRT9|nr:MULTISPECIES: hypothetical protein [Streptomyces]AZK97042.1 hypothetical protein B7R87_26605 [Streptomyces tsukubensis]EIF93122.1 hypothetical protein [Streptomyces tsukubensis NRRL18488]MYS66518.1 hypothetical protein [Streptomyces sp. SID5473]QKM66984.1 hypothetical protein STSU_007175 [Streptomyces tsukubensis NRRL18488]TAI41539.1 hypothetical protein EWI31_27275 [Streptomyces tsukubensis]